MVYTAAVKIRGSEHPIGDRRCNECYIGYPNKCRCGGLIHAEFVKESWEGFKKIETLCDKCGDEFKKNRDNHKKKRRRRY